MEFPEAVETNSLVEAWYCGVVMSVTATAPRTTTKVVTNAVTHLARNSATMSWRFNATTPSPVVLAADVPRRSVAIPRRAESHRDSFSQARSASR